MNIRKEGSKVVHRGVLPELDGRTYGKPTWCRTSGWSEKWVEHSKQIKPPYRKCKICFRNG